jgi:hypothetical protein
MGYLVTAQAQIKQQTGDGAVAQPDGIRAIEGLQKCRQFNA